MSDVKKIELLKDVVHIEYCSGSTINIQIVRDGQVMLFREKTACVCKCKKCGEMSVVFIKSGSLKCCHCMSDVEGFWMSVLPMLCSEIE